MSFGESAAAPREALRALERQPPAAKRASIECANLALQPLSHFQPGHSRPIEDDNLLRSRSPLRAMRDPFFRSLAAVVAVLALAGTAASAPRSKHKDPKPAPEAPSQEAEEPKSDGKPVQVGSYGSWNVYVARGEKSKTCFALATPESRAPAGLNRDPAYVFIASRPGENVRQEVSIIMGFPIKEDAAHVEIGSARFPFITKGDNAWIKNQADEPRLIETLKKGSKLIVKAASRKGRVTADTYSLSGFAQAVERVQKECP